MCKFECYQPGEQCRRVELAKYRFQIAKAARYRMHWKNIAVACGSQRYKAKIDQIAGKRRTIFQRQSGKCLGYERSHECKQRHKGDGDRQIEQDRAYDVVIGDPPRAEHRRRNHTAQCNSRYQPGAREKINVEDRWRLEAKYCGYRRHHEGDEHRSDRRSASGQDKDAGNKNYRKNELESLKNEYPQGLKGRNDKQHDDKQRGETCQKRIAPSFPQESHIVVHGDARFTVGCFGTILARRLRQGGRKSTTWDIEACPCPSPRSRNIGSGTLLVACGERIEIDELRIVWIGIAIELSAAVHVHQGLHTPGI
jgi:hypothetical protein